MGLAACRAPSVSGLFCVDEEVGPLFAFVNVLVLLEQGECSHFRENIDRSIFVLHFFFTTLACRAE